MPRRTLVIALIAVLALAGCGRRGSLDAPGATPAATAPQTEAAPGSGLSPLDPGSDSDGKATTPPAKSPQKHFILDFLI